MTWVDVLSEEQRRALEPRLLTRRYRRGDTVVEQGDPTANVYLIQAGHAAVRTLTPYGDTVTTTVLGPGAGFGEVAQLTEQQTRSASVVALEPMVVRVLPAVVFADLRARVPAVADALSITLAERLRDLTDRFAELAFESVQRRCGRRILQLAEQFSTDSASAAVIPLTQEDLAGIVGATRPTVNQIVGQFAAQGLVVVRRGALEVPDRHRLAAFVR